MSILKVARMGHPVLRERARPSSKPDLQRPDMQKLIDDMIDTMHEYHGVGLAAPQVHEELRLFVALLEEDAGPEAAPSCVVNPEIVPSSRREGRGLGRLPQHSRHPRDGAALHAISRCARSTAMASRGAALKDFAARVAQHETDHLDGVLFFDRMTSMQSLTYLEEFSRYHAADGDGRRRKDRRD